jgi:L-cysteine/cystine lyase
MDRPSPEEQARVQAARTQLPAVESAIYLNTGTAGPLALPTVEAMRQVEEYELRYGRATPDAYDELLGRLEECRAAVAAVLHATPDAVALTRSTTDGLNAAARSIDWRSGDEVVTTSLEHPGLLGPLAALRDLGVTVRVADVGDGGDDAATLGAIEAALSPRTRLVAFSHVTWLTGAVLPAARIVALARAAGAWAAVDGAQTIGAIDVDVPALGAEFYATSAQKWLLGPEAMGALWASPRAVGEARQPHGGWWSTDESTAHAGAGLRPWRDARRLDSTGFHRPSVAGFGRSVGWLAMHVGLPWAQERGPRLAAQVAAGLAGIRGVTVLTPRARMATLVTFRVAGWTHEQALDALARRAFATLKLIPELGAIRASVGWFNTEEELERFLAAVEELTRHTPESYPRRAEITVLGE